MQKFIPFVLFLSLASPTAMADVLGLYVGGGAWRHDPSGSFSSTDPGSDSIDMKSSMNFKEKTESYLWLAFDHPLPILPNIRLEKTGLSHSSSTGGTFNYKGNPVATGATRIQLDSTDAILYYRLLDNWVNFDIGLDLRKIDGEFKIGGDTSKFNETIPMLYLAAQFDLPFSGLSVGGDYRVISSSGSRYSDVRLRAVYEMSVIGFEAGIRSVNLILDNVDGINSDIEFKGLMVGAFLHF